MVEINVILYYVIYTKYNTKSYYIRALYITCAHYIRFETLDKISTGASTLIYYVCWKNTSKFAIKKFVINSNKEAIVNEIHLTGLVNPHPNIIQFYGVTKLNEGGTLGKYLRDNTITFKWESQLKFAKEISSAILWLHVDKFIYTRRPSSRKYLNTKRYNKISR
ncbi:kinase-like domain-containing protein [Rhizophagus irregularis DAOM 181602=DAOM 197198]|nr:kinase-like domain-containing protein [Rhizophagus irregularis DAOM 181602=DAOM 197198]